MRRLPLLALVVALLAGCGGGREHGTATLWVTRDRGAHVVYTGTVPAGLTAMQALDRKLDITTRYGGRFVQSIDGIEGNASRQRDWFYFVNGIEADRGAAEYRLHPGDVEWWDYRSWAHGRMSVPIVVGAFPEPFVHGFDGSRNEVNVVGGAFPAGRKIARLIHATDEPSKKADAFVIAPGSPTFHAEMRDGRVLFFISRRDAVRLAANPKLARFHYEGLG